MRFNVYLSRDFHTRLKEQAKRLDMSVSQYIRFVILKFWGDI
jgi:hypothetical protein